MKALFLNIAMFRDIPQYVNKALIHPLPLVHFFWILSLNLTKRLSCQLIVPTISIYLSQIVYRSNISILYMLSD